MRIGVPAAVGEQTMVAATPKTVARLLELGYEVGVEPGAGTRANYPDQAYADAGAHLVSRDQAWASDLVLAVDPPSETEVGLLWPDSYLATTLAPARSPQLLQQLADRGVTALAMDAVPRISRAQALDVLSSLANLAGYRAVVEAAANYGGLFGGQVTAAGKIPPARVFVVGAGVAGLSATGTAKSLGATVRAFDVRAEVAEQIESMGAQFVALEDTDAQPTASAAPSDGYAAEQSQAQQQAAALMYAEQTAQADVVITTAQIPGKPAPVLITSNMVAAMAPGSVIVDLAAPSGGNCELTVPGARVVSDNGVIILGYTDLASRLPAQASQLYGNNVANLVALLTPQANGQLQLDLADPVQRSMTVTHAGQVLWPPPPVAVSAANDAPAASELTEGVPTAGPSASDRSATAAREAAADHPAQRRRRRAATAARSVSSQLRTRRFVALGLFGLLFVTMTAFSPPELLSHFTVLALAIVVGFYVISKVTSALHTPLMSETNAISGIILVGALLQIGSPNPAVSVLAFVAIVVASINIFGGFWVTSKMLKMFTREPGKEPSR